MRARTPNRSCETVSDGGDIKFRFKSEVSEIIQGITAGIFSLPLDREDKINTLIDVVNRYQDRMKYGNEKLKLDITKLFEYSVDDQIAN